MSMPLGSRVLTTRIAPGISRKHFDADVDAEGSRRSRPVQLNPYVVGASKLNLIGRAQKHLELSGRDGK
jgi:hypothetical protein